MNLLENDVVRLAEQLALYPAFEPFGGPSHNFSPEFFNIKVSYILSLIMIL
jgi:hypothetical protein